MNKELEEFVEAGANLEHMRWARWQKYMFSKGKENLDGSLTIPKELVERWSRQIDTKYKDLSEEERESDRKETRTYLPLLEKALKAQKEAILKKIAGMKGTHAFNNRKMEVGDYVNLTQEGYDQALKDIINII